MLNDILSRHRGPYQFVVYRPGKKPGFSKSEWLKGCVEPEDMAGEALALLSDPRDTIEGISVWAQRDEQFITYFKKDGDMLETQE